MGLFSSLFGKDQAKAARKGAALVSGAEKENKQTAIDTRDASLGDLDAYLERALIALDTGRSEATAPLTQYSETGGMALSRIADLNGLNGPEAQAAAREQVQLDPGYAFRLSEGVKALDQSATARGGTYSGAAMKALNRYGQDYASNEYGKVYGRLSDLVTSGKEAAGAISSTLSNFAQQKANALLGGGQNKANVRMGALSEITGANRGAATATATGIKQAADAKAEGAGNFLSTLTSGAKLLSGWA